MIDDRRVGMHRTLWGGGQSTMQVSSYDGVGRLSWSKGWTGADAASSQALRDWMDGSGNDLPSGGLESCRPPSLAGTLRACFAATLRLVAPSSWYRSPNGSLLEQSSGNTSLWTATRYPSGPGLSSVQTPQDGYASVSWDGRDRLQSLPVTGMTLSWTGDDLLERVSSANGSETRRYDAFGRLVSVLVYGEERLLQYAGSQLLRESSDCFERVWWPSGAGESSAAYTLRWTCDGQLEASWSELAAMDLSPAVYAAVRPALSNGVSFGLLTDLRGDVVGVVDASGLLVESYDYDPYGARELRSGDGVLLCSASASVACASSYGNTQGYAGRFLSAFSGLYDMRARAYSPYLRQFVSPDPLGYGGGSFDLWSYANGDPINLWDTWGLKPENRAPRELKVFGDSYPERTPHGATIGLLGQSSEGNNSGEHMELTRRVNALERARKLANAQGINLTVSEAIQSASTEKKTGKLDRYRQKVEAAERAWRGSSVSDEVMILYHGTDTKFDAIDVTKSDPGDFGVGFYLTPEYEAVAQRGTHVGIVVVAKADLGDLTVLGDAWEAFLEQSPDAVPYFGLRQVATIREHYEGSARNRGDVFQWYLNAMTDAPETVIGPCAGGHVDCETQVVIRSQTVAEKLKIQWE